jgi:hypothetical protein
MVLPWFQGLTLKLPLKADSRRLAAKGLVPVARQTGVPGDPGAGTAGKGKGSQRESPAASPVTQRESVAAERVEGGISSREGVGLRPSAVIAVAGEGVICLGAQIYSTARLHLALTAFKALLAAANEV